MSIIKRKVKVRIKSYNELGSPNTLLEKRFTCPMLLFIGKVVIGIEISSDTSEDKEVRFPEIGMHNYFFPGEYEILEYLEDENLNAIG